MYDLAMYMISVRANDGLSWDAGMHVYREPCSPTDLKVCDGTSYCEFEGWLD